MMKVIRHKAITVLVSFTGDEPLFLMVRDKKHQDWTFVTGGCRRREIENPIVCALRELNEETKNVIQLRHGNYTNYTFTTSLDDQEGTFIYHVYIIEVDMTPLEQQIHISKYQEQQLQPTHPNKKCFDETDGLLWITLGQMKNLKVWKIIRVHVLDNPDFIALLTSSNQRKLNVGFL